jgi:hypothetical protein
MGALSALPIIAAGNACCCLWVISGGAVAAYVLQQHQQVAVTQGDAALAGLLAGIVGAFVYLLLSIPITFLLAPIQQQVMQRILENGDQMPSAVRDYLSIAAGPWVQLVVGFMFMLVAGCVFSTLGGVLGSLFFRKDMAPRGADVPPPSA